MIAGLSNASDNSIFDFDDAPCRRASIASFFFRFLNDESILMGDVQIQGRVANVPLLLLEHDDLKTVEVAVDHHCEEPLDSTGTSFGKEGNGSLREY